MDRAEYKSMAKAQLKNNWGELIIACLIFSIVTTGTAAISVVFEYHGYTGNLIVDVLYGYLTPQISAAAVTMFLVYSLFCSLVIYPIFQGIMAIGMSKYMIKFVNSGKTEINELFGGFTKFTSNLGVGFWYSLYLMLWSFIPFVGLVKTYSYALTFYIKNLHPEYSAKECITLSRNFMNGHKWDIFVLELSFIGWIILCILTLGIGYLWLAPYMEVTSANVYIDILKMNEMIPTDFEKFEQEDPLKNDLDGLL